MLPLGCLPLWRREGVTLIAFLKEWRVTGFPMLIKIIRYNGRRFIVYC
jgi:hypothetical protein